ncbi:MAG: hypothetical protein K6T30_00360 [Alicyclobacillus sp.]|nr:hypothetical protein [Alicyclobacillus sp.]
MHKWLVSCLSVAALFATSTTFAFANVIRSDGQTTGKPAAVQSNPGSLQGQAARSATGTSNKMTHDGLREIWD